MYLTPIKDVDWKRENLDRRVSHLFQQRDIFLCLLEYVPGHQVRQVEFYGPIQVSSINCDQIHSQTVRFVIYYIHANVAVLIVVISAIIVKGIGSGLM